MLHTPRPTVNGKPIDDDALAYVCSVIGPENNNLLAIRDEAISTVGAVQLATGSAIVRHTAYIIAVGVGPTHWLNTRILVSPSIALEFPPDIVQLYFSKSEDLTMIGRRLILIQPEDVLAVITDNTPDNKAI